MQRSSVARFACASVITALALSMFPIPLVADALPQNILPAPILTPLLAQVANVEANAQTLPATTTAATSTPVQTQPQTKQPEQPAPAPTVYPRLVIPSINLNDPIVPVGVDSTGAMAVPSGTTNEVGWYDGGPQPGEVGSAVLDAHIFAAFSKLNEVTTGESMYVEMSPTETLQFVVSKTETYPLSQITSQDLFVPTTNRDLNLITCAGQLTPDHSTYNERFVVYATLVN